MKLRIEQAKKISLDILIFLGFSLQDSKLITKNLLDAELSGKKSHGLSRLPIIKEKLESRELSNSSDDFEIIKNSDTHLLIDAKNKPAFISIYKSMEIAIKKTKKSGICIVGIQNASYCSGFIGSYAREAALSDLIFISFNNSPGGLVPYGSKKELWGTNPLTIAVPTDDIPVILDMASSQITWGDLLIAKEEKKTLEVGVAIDKSGNQTTNPGEAIEGGLLPIAGHKGSGLAFMIEVIAGALTGSRVGYSVEGGWGTSYILINPEIFRPISEFKRDVTRAIKELKESPRANGVEEIFFPGEKSQILSKKQINKDEIEITDTLYFELESILKS